MIKSDDCHQARLPAFLLVWIYEMLGGASLAVVEDLTGG